MGAREKISQVMRFMGSKREGFIRRILSPDGGEGEDFASHAVHGFKARRFHSENSLPKERASGRPGEFLWPRNSLKRSKEQAVV
jgi:hypothetical protein